MDIGQDYLIPIANLFTSFLTTPVVFFGNTIPLYVFILFGLLIGLFLKLLSIVGGVHI